MVLIEAASNIGQLEPASYHECCTLISKVMSLASDFFRAIRLWFIETGLWLKERTIIAFFPRLLVGRLDPDEVFNGLKMSMLAEQIVTIPIEERDVVIDQVLRLILPTMNSAERREIIRAVAAVPADERVAVTNQALRVILPNMNFAERREIIQAIAAVPADERVAVTDQALRVILPNINFIERCAIIEAVAAIPADERVAVTDQALGVILPNMNSAERCAIIQAIAAVPPNERTLVINGGGVLLNSSGGIFANTRAIIIQGVLPTIEKMGQPSAIGIILAIENESSSVNRMRIELPLHEITGLPIEIVISEIVPFL